MGLRQTIKIDAAWGGLEPFQSLIDKVEYENYLDSGYVICINHDKRGNTQ